MDIIGYRDADCCYTCQYGVFNGDDSTEYKCRLFNKEGISETGTCDCYTREE
jgi:hypothetical protein